MNKTEMLSNDSTSVWVVNNVERTYYGRTGVFRAMFHHGKPRVILYEKLTTHPATASDLVSFVPGSHILIMNCEVGRRDLFANSEPIISFFECSVRRSWLPRPVATEYSGVQTVTLYTEFEVARYAWENKAIGTDFLVLKGITRQQIAEVGRAFNMTFQETVEAILQQRNK